MTLRLHGGILSCAGSGLKNRVARMSPAAWYQPGVGVTTSLWPDQSGNSRDMTLYNTPTVNADGSVTFDGVNQYGQALFTFAHPQTIYLVGKQITWTEFESIIDGGTTSRAIQQITGSPKVKLFAGGSTGDNANWTLNTKAIVAAVFNGASSVLQVNATTAVTGDSGSAGSSGGITLGGNQPGTTWANIQAYELIAFSAAHTAAERSVVRNYLAARHGIAL